MSLVDLEKNDVDISKLFAYKSKITLVPAGTTEEVTFYLKVIGDEVQGQARIFALRAGAKLRKNLRNLKWEDRDAYLPDFGVLDKEKIIEVIVALSLQEFTLQSINEVQLTPPTEPKGDASLEEQEKYQTLLDEYPKKFSKIISERLDKRATEFKEVLQVLDRDRLIGRYEDALIDQLVLAEFNKNLYEYVISKATFIDKDYINRAFESAEFFKNMPKELKNSLISKYQQMEIKSQDLKKLPEVTQ